MTLPRTSLPLRGVPRHGGEVGLLLTLTVAAFVGAEVLRSIDMPGLDALVASSTMTVTALQTSGVAAATMACGCPVTDPGPYLLELLAQ